MKTAIGILLILAAFIVGGYISIWWGIVEPVMNLARMIDAHTLTAMAFAGELIKFLVRDIIAVLVFLVLFFFGKALID